MNKYELRTKESVVTSDREPHATTQSTEIRWVSWNLVEVHPPLRAGEEGRLQTAFDVAATALGTEVSVAVLPTRESEELVGGDQLTTPLVVRVSDLSKATSEEWPEGENSSAVRIGEVGGNVIGLAQKIMRGEASLDVLVPSSQTIVPAPAPVLPAPIN